MKFRKKPVVIESIQFDGENATEAAKFCGVMCSGPDVTPVTFLDIHTLEGVMRADIGDWIIKGIKGEFYPCKPDIFAATYELVDDTANVTNLPERKR